MVYVYFHFTYTYVHLRATYSVEMYVSRLMTAHAFITQVTSVNVFNPIMFNKMSMRKLLINKMFNNLL